MEPVVEARRRRGHVFDVTTASGHVLAVAAGPSRGSEGPAPMELMLVSLATCSASTLAEVLERMRRPVDDLRVLVSGARAERPPRAWTRVHLVYQVRGEVPPGRLERALEVTGRACSAEAMLSRVVALTREVIQVRRVDPAETRALRRRILRPHQSLEELVVPGEEGEGAGWFAAVRGAEEVVGTAGVLPEDAPDAGIEGGWRIRAMATDETVRGSGLGRMLLDACLDHVRAAGGRRVWAEVRLGSVGFYQAAGFTGVGETFERPGIGPHVRMERGV